MVDIRFHPNAGSMPLAELLCSAGFADAVDDPRASSLMVGGAHELAIADSGHVALAAHRDYADDLRMTGAGAVVVTPALREAVPASAIAVVSRNPHGLFTEILHRLYPDNTRAVLGAFSIGPSPLFEQGVVVGANVVIGAGVEIGSGTVIGANTVIGPGVAIGRDCLIGSNCSIDCAYLGNRVVLHPGARIGTEGFGWLELGRTNRKIPQLGRVILQDGVEIGANTTIDRGALGDTVIGEGTKIDNLVQIAHNCQIGRYCLMAGCSALAGSTVVEDGVMFAGGAGATGHLTIGRGTTIYARGAVTKDVAPGSVVAGFPAQDVRSWRRSIAALRRLAKGDES